MFPEAKLSVLLYLPTQNKKKLRRNRLLYASCETHESNGRSNPEVVGSIPTEVKIIFSLPRVVL